MEYIIIFTILFLLSLLEVSYSIDVKNRIFNLVIILLIIFVGTRDGNGADYYRYEALFKTITWNKILLTDDIGFTFITLIFKSIHFYSNTIFLMFAIINFLLLQSVIKKLCNYRYPALLIYFALYMIPFSFNAMAQGIATLIILYSLQYFESKNTRKILILAVFAYLFHFIGLLLPILYVIYRFKITKKNIIPLLLGITVLSICLYIFVSKGVIINYLPGRLKAIFISYFVDYEDSVDIVSISARIVMLCFVAYGYRRFTINTRKIFFIYVLGLYIYFILIGNSLLATRINLTFKMLEMIIIPNMLFSLKEKFNKVFIICILAIFLFIVLCSALQYKEIYPYKTWLF